MMDTILDRQKDRGIPKVIHYCWCGKGEKPPIVQDRIKSWKEYCPEWCIVEWNESNFDVNCCEYTKEAYAKKSGHLFQMLLDWLSYVEMVAFIWTPMSN